MTNTSPNGAWVFEKAILVYTPDFDVSCFAVLRIAHDKKANEGSISLKITADLANLSVRSPLMLNISPGVVKECTLARKSNDRLCPPGLFSMLPARVKKVSAVSTLSLTLRKTGIVVCPTGMESLSPANPGDLNFDAFAKICHSTSLCLYISQRQCADEELDQLEIFSGALRSLQAKTFKNARHGVEERDCGVFARWLNPNPPPYPEERVSEQGDPPVYCKHSEQVIGKRRTGSMSPDDKARKRLLLTSPGRLGSTSPEALGSPTEANTPSTCSSSPSSIRPTDFILASSPGRTKRKRLARLEEELRGVSDEEICQVLIRSGRRHLLALQKYVSDLPSESETVGIANVKMLERRLKHSLKQYVDETIEQLKSQVVGDIVESALNECDEAIEGRYRTHEADLEEQVDDYKVDLGITANDCTKEIEEQALRCMDDIEDQGIRVEKSATERFAELTRCLSDSAQSLLDSKSSPGQRRTEGTEARRLSI